MNYLNNLALKAGYNRIVGPRYGVPACYRLRRIDRVILLLLKHVRVGK